VRLVNVDMLPDDGSEEALRERSRRFQLARVLKVTEQMLEHANAGNWELVEELEAHRSIELQECFATQDDTPSELVAEALEALVYLNDQVVQLVRYAKERTATDRYEHRRALHVASVYGDGL
jgi:hypothetical protein